MNLRVLNLSALAIVFMSFLFLDLARAESPDEALAKNRAETQGVQFEIVNSGGDSEKNVERQQRLEDLKGKADDLQQPASSTPHQNESERDRQVQSYVRAVQLRREIKYQTLSPDEIQKREKEIAEIDSQITNYNNTPEEYRGGPAVDLDKTQYICIAHAPGSCNNNQVGGAGNANGGVPVPKEKTFDERARAKIEAEVEDGACAEATRNANAGCNPNENPGLKSAISMADQVAGPGGMASSMASSPQAACGGMNQVLGAVNGGLLTFKGYCSAKFFSCSSACSEEIKATQKVKDGARYELRMTPQNTNAQLVFEQSSYKLKELQKVNRSCQANAENLGSAMINIVGIVKTMMVAKQCEQMALNSTEALCKKYPHAAICTGNKPVDCADPQMRMSNVVCICMTNPSDSRCAGGGIDIVGSAGRGGGGRAGSGAADGVGGAGLGGGAMPLDLASESNGMGNVAPGRAADPKGGTLGGGSGGNKSGLSGDTGSPKGNPGVAGREPPNKNINSGYYGGGSGGGNYSGGRYGGGGSYGSTSGAANANFDLKPYLPNGKLDATRGLANSAGPDGITGPNSNIWQKVKVRYYTVSPSLLP